MRICPKCAGSDISENWKCSACGFEPPISGGFPSFATEPEEDGSGFQPDSFAELAALEAGSFWFQARNKLIVWALKRHFPELDRFLEIGCGTGFVLSAVVSAFPNAIATGSEIFSIGLPYAANRVQDAEFLQMDARSMPYASEFDVVGAFDVLEHIEEDGMVLSEMFRATKPGGGIAITVPQHPSLWSYQDEYACHVRRYSVGELREKVQRAGFRVELQTSFVSFLLPAMYFSRRIKKRNLQNRQANDELRLSPLINSAFSAVMDMERQLIRVGARFAIGGSLILVGRKPKE